MNMEFRKKEYKPFDIFDSEWAAITVGNREKFSACLVSCGDGCSSVKNKGLKLYKWLEIK